MAAIVTLHQNENGTAHAATEVQTWADRVTQSWRAAVDSIITVGRALIAAKEQLPHGDFGRLFHDHPDHVQAPVPFSSRAAQALMKIARHPVITNPQHVAVLPASWGTLHELTKVPEVILVAAIADGRVRPEMERADAERLRTDLDGMADIDRIVGIIRADTLNWPPKRLVALERAISDDLQRRAGQLHEAGW